jgi:hypothetical protein
MASIRTPGRTVKVVYRRDTRDGTDIVNPDTKATTPLEDPVNHTNLFFTTINTV